MQKMNVSRPDLRDPLNALFVGEGVTRVGNLFIFLCWPSMVPNQRQLSIVVSDWGSHLGSPFSPPSVVGSCLCLLHGLHS